MATPSDEGFDLDQYDCADYASARESENMSSTDMESESVWTPVRRHKKRKAYGSPLNQSTFSQTVQSTIKKVPQIMLIYVDSNMKTKNVLLLNQNALIARVNTHQIVKLVKKKWKKK